MEIIYKLIAENPHFFTWVFGLINILWGLFIYFNKQSHEKNIKSLEQNIKFGFDRRLKIFELKAAQYSQYVTDLDNLGKKNQVEIPAKMTPIIQRFFIEYMEASESGNCDREREVVAWLSSTIKALMDEGIKDVLKLKYESNRLKLIATDEMLETFDVIEKLNQKIFDLTSEYMNNFVDFVIAQNDEETALFQSRVASLGLELQKYSRQLLFQMRKEIVDI